jgi:Zn-dependent proteases
LQILPEGFGKDRTSMLNVLLRGHLDWFTIVANLAVLCVVAFVVFPARGMAQAFVAYKLGDPTAKYNGRLSMNPLAHMDKYGIVVLFLCGLGFIKPIPINSRNFRNPRRDMILTILAGPVMGLLVGMLGVALYRVGLLFVTSAASVSKLWLILEYMFAETNVRLAVLMLLPLPFFDGYQILSFFLPPKWVYFIEQNGMIISLVVLVLLVSGALSVPLDAISTLFMKLFNFIFMVPSSLRFIY